MRPWLLKREVRRLSAHLHRKEFPDWLLRPSFSSKDLSFTNRSFAWPGTPPPSAILDSGGPNHCGGSGEGGAESAARTHVAAGLCLLATCSPSPAPVELQLQLPDTTTARRQRISVRLSFGTASVGVVPDQSLPFAIPQDHSLKSPAWAERIVLGGPTAWGAVSPRAEWGDGSPPPRQA